ncbi:hypothetical protein OIDMADRAFT_38403 [Oidiodendron maius Zn]|uniref:Uncharacterized protein n=1 Tax=Oidiodendron maius (strain Zn) TaxID=913774 RepID=A0A0C3HSM9_OIDMZ|nr:hypothetical protein OIDMADRAFT_38403 [Oidiodendron maius Zn]
MAVPEKDSSNTASSTTQPHKLTSKASSAGVQIPTKFGRKNGTAKDSGDGGVLAAVTKNTSKMSNNKPSNISSQLQTAELIPAGSTSNGNPVASPLLDALSSAALTQPFSQTTNEWAKNPEAFSSSKNNLVPVDDSSDTQPSSYEDKLVQFGWTTREKRGISPPGSLPTSTSPPINRQRPISYHLDGNYPRSTEDFNAQISSYAARRSSMFSQYSRYGPQPPLPHQAQAHFFGAPDASLLLSHPTPGHVPGDSGYYCGFDSWPVHSEDSPKGASNVVLIGYDRGLDVYAVGKRGLSKISAIGGLRGGVYNAKILSQGCQNHSPPLMAVVVHGPAWSSSDISNEGTSAAPPDVTRDTARDHSVPGLENDTAAEYQTTVEVYSLETKQHVTTLLSLPKSHAASPPTSPLFRPPAPVGSLSIRADGRYLAIASGTTGETWVFRQEKPSRPSLAAFRCIGKVWTTVQHGLTVDPNGLQGDVDWRHADPSSARQQYRPSILSLNGRWLAYCPSSPSSQVSLRGTIYGVSPSERIPGLNGQAPPQLPPVNCMAEIPGGESMVKQFAQAATQEVIKGAAYLGKQGVQAWNNYWNKPSSQQTAHETIPYSAQPSIAHQFPPTHGVTNQTPVISKDPGLISVLDLDNLSRHTSSTGASPHPLATFKVPHGCSFLSFAPNGLALFTASSKGDVQFVWDLMRIQYTKSSFLRGVTLGNGSHSPHVRQIAQFSRMTIARIVDVVWTSPHGERAAMVTEPGTVHILDLPASAFTWPPLRQRLPSRRPDDDAAGAALSAAGVASSAVNSLWTAARPLVTRRRRSSAGISSISAATVTSQAGHGTQALAAGISRSVGAATGRMNEMRKSGSPKLHLPRGTATPSRACVRLLNGKRNDLVLVLASGIVGAYTVRSRRADRPADKQKASKGAKYVEFRLPPLPDFKTTTTAADHRLDPEKDLGSPHPQFKARNDSISRSRGAESSIPQAEIESNAPYQPFHTDRRVNLHVYSCDEPLVPSPSVSALLIPTEPSSESTPKSSVGSKTPWSFGGKIKSTRLNVGPVQPNEDSFYVPSDHVAPQQTAIERVMKVEDFSGNLEQIVVTTRMRKSVRGDSIAGAADEDGFFEDDCEVLDFASQRV